MGDYHSIVLGNFGLMWACDCHPLSLWHYVLQIDYFTLPFLGGFVGQFCGLFFAPGWVW